ncbi:glycosyltransferase family 2 protein [Streptomyces reniochalinae]|uniref:Family 2 glycosyl transferase n=1 Tax=Streptomyces reniochalinae TaxID=2250578 RepID=A0A367EYG6_9ACTN|nr:glycosyltransferase family 2 protein [Streptomyces reniochalinae]RCG23206.1 family 2 glycosyl transferase [Streptomyces reniochalinae]
MSVHSHMAAHYEAAAAGLATVEPPEFPRHVVTAVIVAHDGRRWLPDALRGLLEQSRPVQNIIAADTGSADDSAELLTESLGAERVLHMARRTGFGTAVEEASRTARRLTPEDLPYLKRPSGWDPVNRTWRDDAYDMPELPYGEPVEWLWLLHDDCAPEADALAELLRVVDADSSVGIAGPKLRSWYDHRQLLEAGVSLANSGRRWTGIDRREQDQGQYDQVRPVLAVSTAGMLIRRDVFDQLGGFDRALPLMRDDVDLCWRAQAAGHRVLVAPDSVVRHAEAASRERRPVDCVGRASRSGASPHRVDKAGAVYTLLANTSKAMLPWVLSRLVFGTLVRTLAYLVGKVPGQALDEITGLSGTLLRAGRVLGARRRRGRPVVPYKELRPLFPPPGATLRVTLEQVTSNFSGRSEAELSAGGRHGAVESGPSDDDADFLEIEQFARVKRVARKPGPVLFAVLLIVSLVACRSLLGGGALAGGALLPVPDTVSDLWARYLDGWHPVGTGGTESAPPYLAVLATFATLLFGSTSLALTLLLVCSVPLAGLTAYFASRPLVDSRLVRAWGSVAYAFLPAATGALAQGRIGTAVLAILLPLLARAAVSACGLHGKGGWRSAWAYALLLTLTTAFTPLVWPLALVLAVVVLAVRVGQGGSAGMRAARLGVALVTPVLLLAPWSLSLLTDPGMFLSEVGLEYGTGAASAIDLLTASPGGPGTTDGLFLVGLLLAGLAALLRGERQPAVRAAWVVALTGLVFAALSNGSAWAGPATLVYGIGLLSAAAVGAEGAKERVAAQSFGWRQPVAALVAAAAVFAPLCAAVGWMAGGADGPLSRRDPVQVPAFVAEESTTSDQARTLVLDQPEGAAEVGYTLVRGSGARLGDADLAAVGGDDARLDNVVSHLVAGSGADQTSQLGGYAVRYVLLRDGTSRQVSRTLDATPGLTRLSQEDGSALWRVDRQVSRVSIVPGGEKSGAGGAVTAPVAVASGPVESHATLPTGPSGRVLRLADEADSGWQASLDGSPLKDTTVDGWAQGFELPTNGGKLTLTYETPLTHTVWVWAQGFLLLVVLVLALPGRRREVDDDLPDAPPAPDPAAGDGRRARRLRAAAEAATTAPGVSEDPSVSETDGGAEPHGLPEQPAHEPYGEQQPYVPQQPGHHPGAQHDAAAGTGYAEHASYEQSAYEQPAHGYDAYGQPSYGQVPHQQPYAGPPYDQRSYDQQSYGQQSWGQPPYDQQSYGSQAYGEQVHDQQAYGQQGGYDSWQAQPYAAQGGPGAYGYQPGRETGYEGAQGHEDAPGYDGTPGYGGAAAHDGYDNRYGNGSEQQ